MDLLPTIHEGATVRAMEKKGIRTEKGEFNRWIRATNAVIRDIKKKITSLMGWIADIKAELAKPQTPDLVSLLNAYYTQRKAGAYSQKGKISNLKEMNETFNYCNGDSTTKYGKLRAERGHTEPYNVLLWSLGNEMGYGHMEGDNTASGYSHLARKNGNQMLTVCRNLTLCSSGPYPNEEWVTYSAKPLSDIAPLVSAHHYGPRPAYNDIAKLPSEYKKCLSGVTETRNRIRRLRAMLGNNQIISFDEWNAWYGWYRPSCVIDGMYAAMMMHMFIDEARKSDIGIVCHFEAVNESAIKVTPNAALLTATGAMLKLMKLHSNARLLFADDFAVVTEKDRTVTMTLINFSHENEQKFCGKIKGACIKACAYVGNNLMPNSNFDEQPLSVVRNGDSFETTLKPLSVALIQFIQQ